MAIASGKVEQVNRLVHVGITNGCGICGLLEMYDEAAHQLYKPQSYSKEDTMWGLLLWHLGGA